MEITASSTMVPADDHLDRVAKGRLWVDGLEPLPAWDDATGVDGWFAARDLWAARQATMTGTTRDVVEAIVGDWLASLQPFSFGGCVGEIARHLPGRVSGRQGMWFGWEHQIPKREQGQLDQVAHYLDARPLTGS